MSKARTKKSLDANTAIAACALIVAVVALFQTRSANEKAGAALDRTHLLEQSAAQSRIRDKVALLSIQAEEQSILISSVKHAAQDFRNNIELKGDVLLKMQVFRDLDQELESLVGMCAEWELVHNNLNELVDYLHDVEEYDLHHEISTQRIASKLAAVNLQMKAGLDVISRRWQKIDQLLAERQSLVARVPAQGS